MHTDGVRASVIVPTIGRSDQLEATLAAICSTAPPELAEVIVIEQGGRAVAKAVAARLSDPRVKVIDDAGRGAARARNLGASAATGGLVLFTDDDCEPRSDWVGAAARLHRDHPTALLTGAVLAPGDPAAVPSTKEEPTSEDYTGTRTASALYSGNMAVSRRAFLEFGGFDERFPSAGGEDNDLCYRWLSAGRALRYEPELVVTHLDWRRPEEMAAVRVEYARTQGMFYAKHLRRGDLRILRFIAGDVWAALCEHVLRRHLPAPGAPPLRVELRSIRENWARFGPDGP